MKPIIYGLGVTRNLEIALLNVMQLLSWRSFAPFLENKGQVLSKNGANARTKA